MNAFTVTHFRHMMLYDLLLGGGWQGGRGTEVIFDDDSSAACPLLHQRGTDTRFMIV